LTLEIYFSYISYILSNLSMTVIIDKFLKDWRKWWWHSSLYYPNFFTERLRNTTGS